MSSDNKTNQSAKTNSFLSILGRQPALALAELESLLGADSLHPVGQKMVVINTQLDNDALVNIASRLGGCPKIAKIIDTLPIYNWSQIEKHLLNHLPSYLLKLPPGKIKLGLSAYELDVTSRQLTHLGMELKKTLRQNDRSVRIVPNTDVTLGSAQILHNQLTTNLGAEIVVARDGPQIIIAQTIFEQNITAYAARDQARPARDSQVGMLPPKLAQIIVNLSVGATPPSSNDVILDPFCGTGVILQEAMLMGFGAYGSDLDPRMVDYASRNMAWLIDNGPQTGQQTSKLHQVSKIPQLEQADATSHNWSPEPNFIACETYLGRPFSSTPQLNVLRGVMEDVHQIHKKFLQNVAHQTNPGFRLCLAVPAWKTEHGFLRLKTLDSLEKLGYTRREFVHASSEELIYHRPGQQVARELVVLTRK